MFYSNDKESLLMSTNNFRVSLNTPTIPCFLRKNIFDSIHIFSQSKAYCKYLLRGVTTHFFLVFSNSKKVKLACCLESSIVKLP